MFHRKATQRDKESFSIGINPPMKISLSLCVASVFYILLALSDGRNGPLERGVGIPTIGEHNNNIDM